MYCPKCGYKQKCACDSSVCGNKDGQIHIGNDILKCFNCGLSKHIDWWGNLEMECYKEEMFKDE